MLLDIKILNKQKHVKQKLKLTELDR
jgi:hypothetical protein